MTLICAGSVVIDGELCRPGWIRTAGHKIADCGTGTAPLADFDFPDSIVVPGFVDIHVHGGAGASFADADAGGRALIQASEFHLRHGTTTMLASLVTAAPAQLLSAVAKLAEAISSGRSGTIAGIHLEGPWLSPARCGAHDHTQVRAPDPAEIDALLAAANGTIRMVTLAPELPGSADTIRRFLAAGVVVALGHSDATYEQTCQAIGHGATVATHLFNAMAPLGHREPGPALALLKDPAVTLELIADGVHVHPAVVAAVIEAVGPDRVALVTDAIAAAGCGDGTYRLGSVPIEVESNVARVCGTPTIAGSTATMDRLFRAAFRAGAGAALDAGALAAAVQMTSATPARAVGLARRGSLRAGFDANLVVLDRDLRVAAVMANGEWQAVED
ncbi:N-acetylglucosamine-6-phosphate deacetylase [Mycobacterium ulcerans]|uniref:N-acetylglucosamine-6-phosphate deacetylase n=2 Tax=Mycobacterium ulcerans TaxID=1809 RepID=A0PNQ6_MYCUA|nr:N-acetylglucosamine-6-phosphate deacetylase [Mycobacterium ulcerans]ABL03975.1 n-acetylglucosamine-6-phosphate deacetylase NagA [Mycobacterium ulcerans Agy99]MEB3905154.1 N-acetylglucosamine-6-phosphate deacetylase [Mycobacterium ulcerans]MEB3909359.1 N-acetylglucosamine-6-phosphate deacetylase [Mycobacterium ulcerans]MEB3919608.1 N-acetylglucosamine-6-phosphate deacetylase [Mycobacterium ulcerans]MEB3923679.1 N-acetylglucosamine-6-phosphate deacetylase [Mycobacterium ulcerans]